MYPIANTGTIILVCIMLFALSFAISAIFAKVFIHARKKKEKKLCGFDIPAQMISRRDVPLEEYVKNSTKHTSDGTSAIDNFVH